MIIHKSLLKRCPMGFKWDTERLFDYFGVSTKSRAQNRGLQNTLPNAILPNSDIETLGLIK